MTFKTLTSLSKWQYTNMSSIWSMHCDMFMDALCRAEILSIRLLHPGYVQPLLIYIITIEVLWSSPLFDYLFHRWEKISSVRFHIFPDRQPGLSITFILFYSMVQQVRLTIPGHLMSLLFCVCVCCSFCECCLVFHIFSFDMSLYFILLIYTCILLLNKLCSDLDTGH